MHDLNSAEKLKFGNIAPVRPALLQHNIVNEQYRLVEMSDLLTVFVYN